MQYKTISFTVPGASSAAQLVCYVPENDPELKIDYRRPAVVICPGGGYSKLAYGESEPIALRLMSLGFNAFVLKYHVNELGRYPIPQLEAAWAVAYVKDHAKELNTIEGKVFIAGFSAGGHLAASLGILWDQEPWAATLSLSKERIRPDGMVLSYPVITSGSLGHQGSFDCLLGEERPALNDALSLEKRVHATAVPAYIWHTFDDIVVPVENSLSLATQLRAFNVPFEMHIYATGVHGLSLCDGECWPDKPSHTRKEYAVWIEHAARWMKEL